VEQGLFLFPGFCALFAKLLEFKVSVVTPWFVCGAKTSYYVNLHFLLLFPPCLWSFSGVCGLSGVCLWCPNFCFGQLTLPSIISNLSVVVFRCLWFVCGLFVVPKHQIMSIYTFTHFQVSVVSLGSVCGALTSDLVNLHFLLSFPPCLWSFSGVCGA
jgi:hypothetical protein